MGQNLSQHVLIIFDIYFHKGFVYGKRRTLKSFLFMAAELCKLAMNGLNGRAGDRVERYLVRSVFTEHSSLLENFLNCRNHFRRLSRTVGRF